jgi:hypothetical protein
LVVPWIAVNLVALLVSTKAYTAWTIRMRNGTWALLSGSRKAYERASRADELAERYAPRIRIVALVVVNALMLGVAYNVLANP